MTIEQFEKAKALQQEISQVEDMKKRIEDETFIKVAHGLTEDMLEAGKSAMLAVADEALDALQRKMDRI